MDVKTSPATTVVDPKGEDSRKARHAQRELIAGLARGIDARWPALPDLRGAIATHGWAYAHAAMRVVCRRTQLGHAAPAERLLVEARSCVESFLEAFRLTEQMRNFYRASPFAKHAQRLQVTACLALLVSCYLRRLMVQGDPAPVFSPTFRLQQLLSSAKGGGFPPASVLARALQPTLSLRSSGVDADALRQIAAILRHLPETVWIDLSFNRICPSAIPPFIQTLRVKPHAVPSDDSTQLQLDLSWSCFAAPDSALLDWSGLGFLDVSGARLPRSRLASTLAARLVAPDCALHTLGLRALWTDHSVGLPLDIAQKFRNALRRNRSLTKLDLANNHISDPSLDCLLESLAPADDGETSALQWLNLSGASLTRHGLCAIGGMLHANRSLQFLLLNNTVRARTNDDDLVELSGRIAQAARNHPTLTGLYLANNHLPAAATSALFAALQGNRSLQRLEVSGNWLDDGAVAALVKSLAVNTSLCELSALQMLSPSLRPTVILDAKDVERGDEVARWRGELEGVLNKSGSMLTNLRCSVFRRVPPALLPVPLSFDLTLPDGSTAIAIDSAVHGSAQLDASLLRNKRRGAERTMAWRSAAVAISFLRANRDSPLATSILPLLADVMRHLPDLDPPPQDSDQAFFHWRQQIALAPSPVPKNDALSPEPAWSWPALARRAPVASWSSLERVLRTTWARRLIETARSSPTHLVAENNVASPSPLPTSAAATTEHKGQAARTLLFSPPRALNVKTHHFATNFLTAPTTNRRPLSGAKRKSTWE